MKRYGIAEVVEAIRSKGINVNSFSECSDVEDGDVSLDNGFSVQVPTYEHGLYLCKVVDGKVKISEPMTLEKILEKIA